MKQVNNALYKTSLVIGASAIKQVLWYFCNILVLKNSLLPGSGIRIFFLRAFGARIGKGVVIKPSVNIKFPWKLQVGDQSWIGEKVWIDNLEQVVIGQSVCLSQGAFLLTGNHDYKKITFDLITAPIQLEDGVWIGAAAIVCPGVTCGSHAVLSVASVATKSLEPYSIYRGNPALKTGERIIG
jgi:putative colanic acid biosynthesis acetyltransferase WcaF